MIELENIMAEYEFFEFYNDWPNLLCVYQNYIIEDEILSLYTGENAYFNYCQLHIDLGNVEIQVVEVTDKLDCIHIKDGKRTCVLHAHKKNLRS